MRIVPETYRRAFSTARDVPLLLALPIAAELAQHAAEIWLGLYAGNVGAAVSPLRIAFGAAKVVAILVTIVFALRFWRARDEGGVRRPGMDLVIGLVTVLVVQVGGGLLLRLAGAGVAHLLHVGRAGQIVAVAAPILLWLFLIGALIPWYVGLLTGDQAMTLRRALESMVGRLPWAFVIQLAGYLPLMIVHYVLSFGAMGRPIRFVWPLMIVDAGVVALLVLTIASTYYALYRRA